MKPGRRILWAALFTMFLSVFPSLKSQAATVAQTTAGYILLQVEKNGEAWYVYPKTLTRYYLGRPDDAFSIMRGLGLGITNANLAKIPIAGSTATGDTALRKQLSGYILLQVEKNGEAWYVYPKNQRRYYLGRPADAFSIMRRLGLGITNANLSMITNQAVADGKQYSANHCQGEQIKKLTTPPIDPENMTYVEPYGLMVSAHVMPVSHGYIWPGMPGGSRDQFNVYAMADSTLYGIGSRSINVDTGQPKQTEYSLQFSVSCVEFYYYDLMTSLTPELQKIFDEHPGQSVNIPVKAGQLLGKIGGQTLDYAVWDFNKTLTGYIQPAHYDGDAPRMHLVDPLEYETDELKQIMLAKYLRSAEPISGKVDYDIDGTLFGGWFQAGTGFYSGTDPNRYWAGHLAIAPEYIDPTMTVISMGTFDSRERQLSISRSAPDPRTVGIDAGVVTYDLFTWVYIDAAGQFWDHSSLVKGLTTVNTLNLSQGCAVFQLVEKRKLKAEFFPSISCSEVSGFSSAAKTYIR